MGGGWAVVSSSRYLRISVSPCLRRIVRTQTHGDTRRRTHRYKYPDTYTRTYTHTDVLRWENYYDGIHLSFGRDTLYGREGSIRLRSDHFSDSALAPGGLIYPPAGAPRLRSAAPGGGARGSRIFVRANPIRSCSWHIS